MVKSDNKCASKIQFLHKNGQKTLSLRHSGRTLGKIRSNFQNFGLQSWIFDQFLFIIFEILLKINIFQVFLIKPKVFGSHFLGNLNVVMTFH